MSLREIIHSAAGLSIALIVMLSASSQAPAQDLSYASFAPYQDEYGLIYSTKVDPSTHVAVTNNGLLYTAEACVIMTLQSKPVAFDRTAISNALAACQVHGKPGLFHPSPATNFQDSQDDYVGVAALAGVCGYHDIAKSVLAYGEGTDQPLALSILAMKIPTAGNSVLELFNNSISCLPNGSIVPYNYNNVDPGKFTFASWMGRYPMFVPTFELAAGETPSDTDFAIWSGALLESCHIGASSATLDTWVLDWLMVLTYQTSGITSPVADEAVSDWWIQLHKFYPGGMKDVMSAYLGSGSSGNPYAQYIADFRNAKAPQGSADYALVSSIEGFANSLSPTEFIGPYKASAISTDVALKSAQVGLSGAQTALSVQQAAVEKATDAVNDVNRSIASLSSIQSAAVSKLSSLLLQQSKTPAQILKSPGSWLPQIKKGPFGIPILLPPIWIGPVFIPNPALKAMAGLVSAQTGLVSAVAGQMSGLEVQRLSALAALKAANAALSGEADALQVAKDAVEKASAAADGATNELSKAQSVLAGFIPGVPIPLLPCGI